MIEALTNIQWIVICMAALSIGMSKTGIQGLMLMIVPLMAMAFGAKESTGVILPMLCMADIIAVTYYKRIADWRIVARLLPTAVLGFFLAIAVDNFIPSTQFRTLMGWTLMLVLIVMIYSEIFGRESIKESRWSNKWWYAAFFGLLGGFTTMIGNAAGPVMSIYLLSMRRGQNSAINKMEYIGINAWFFLVINLLKLPLQAFVWHNITWNTLRLNLLMLPVIAIGSLIGIRIVKLLPEKIFRIFIQTVTVLSVILMII